MCVASPPADRIHLLHSCPLQQQQPWNFFLVQAASHTESSRQLGHELSECDAALASQTQIKTVNRFKL